MTKTADQNLIIPYPQTPDSAWEWMRAHGISQSELARRIGVNRLIIVDLLRGQLKGHRGDAHRGAVALGLKPDPSTLELDRRGDADRRRGNDRRREPNRRAAA